MIDNGQAVDVRGISDRSMVKLLKKLFLSLKLKKNDNGLFLLPTNKPPTLDIIGSLLPVEIKSSSLAEPTELNDGKLETLAKESAQKKDEPDNGPSEELRVNSDLVSQPKRLVLHLLLLL